MSDVHVIDDDFSTCFDSMPRTLGRGVPVLPMSDEEAEAIADWLWGDEPEKWMPPPEYVI